MKKVLPIILVLAVGATVFAWFRFQAPAPNDTILTLFGNIDIREAQLTFNASEHVNKILVELVDYSLVVIQFQALLMILIL